MANFGLSTLVPRPLSSWSYGHTLPTPTGLGPSMDGGGFLPNFFAKDKIAGAKGQPSTALHRKLPSLC